MSILTHNTHTCLYSHAESWITQYGYIGGVGVDVGHYYAIEELRKNSIMLTPPLLILCPRQPLMDRILPRATKMLWYQNDRRYLTHISTAKTTENDTLTGFNLGADDYISKPFSIKEVIARV